MHLFCAVLAACGLTVVLLGVPVPEKSCIREEQRIWQKREVKIRAKENNEKNQNIRLRKNGN